MKVGSAGWGSKGDRLFAPLSKRDSKMAVATIWESKIPQTEP
jgi:hypothetical protein